MSEPDPSLTGALLEIEHHVGAAGWDQPARLFALVPTAELLAAEPSLAEQLGSVAPAPGQLSAIEQDDFVKGEDLGTALAALAWPDGVAGVALSLERYFLPGAEDATVPANESGTEQVRTHPRREEIRVITGVLRSGARYGVARIRSHPDELLSGDDLVPGLAAALARTLD